jgi:chromatin remodeling complex protein RSC6
MAPTKKQTATTSDAPVSIAQPPVESAAAPAAAPAASAENKKRGGRKAKTAEAPTEAPVVTVAETVPAPVAETLEAAAVVVEETANKAEIPSYPTLLQRLKDVQTQANKNFQALIGDIKLLYATQQRENRRKGGKKPRAEKAASGRVKNVGGFQKPVAVHNDLLQFMGLPEGTLVSRIEAGKFLCNYVNTNNLKVPNNGRFVHPDERIVKLLKLPTNEPYDTFGSQKLFNHLFPASRKTLAAASAPTAAA